MNIEAVADCACVVGEGPLWHPDEQCLYWTDIDAGRLFRYHPATSTHEQVYEGEKVGGLTLQADGALLLFMARGAIKIWRDGVLTTVVEEIPDERETRFNDVIADPVGRVFCGTMPAKEKKARLYLLDTDGSLRVVLEGVGLSNGMGFTPDVRHLYFTDSTARSISLFDYEQATGIITNRRLFVQTPDEEGVPDGMTVDAEGYVWSARWGGSCLVRYAPDGTEEQRISLPAPKVSCPVFGGAEYSDLYITTAGGDKREADGPEAGVLFRMNTGAEGIRGVPEFRSRIGL
jgi:sugar lactone lactonase YvrE